MTSFSQNSFAGVQIGASVAPRAVQEREGKAVSVSFSNHIPMWTWLPPLPSSQERRSPSPGSLHPRPSDTTHPVSHIGAWQCKQGLDLRKLRGKSLQVSTAQPCACIKAKWTCMFCFNFFPVRHQWTRWRTRAGRKLAASSLPSRLYTCQEPDSPGSQVF